MQSSLRGMQYAGIYDNKNSCCAILGPICLPMYQVYNKRHLKVTLPPTNWLWGSEKKVPKQTLVWTYCVSEIWFTTLYILPLLWSIAKTAWFTHLQSWQSWWTFGKFPRCFTLNYFQWTSLWGFILINFSCKQFLSAFKWNLFEQKWP